MSGKRILTAILVVALPGLLGACGPGNTLVGRHSPGANGDSRLKSVETGLHQLQEQVKAIKHHQTENDAHIAALQKRLGLPVVQKTTPGPAVPQGSALGTGFTHPEAESPAPAATSPSPPTVAQAQPAPQLSASFPTPIPQPAATPKPTETATAPSPLPRPARHTPAVGGKGAWVGPPTAAKHRTGSSAGSSAPATPEAAIAADRSAGVTKTAQPAPVGVTTPSPTAPTPTPPTAQPTPAATAPQPTPTAPPTATPTQPALIPGNPERASAAGKVAYNQALQLAINGHRAEAKAAFDQFMAAHPKSPLVPNALYWIGEGAYQSGEYKAALADFEKVAKGWPGHHKAADSLYKIAMTQEKSGNIAAARVALERYLKDYPNAELAGAARQKLQTLGR